MEESFSLENLIAKRLLNSGKSGKATGNSVSQITGKIQEETTGEKQNPVKAEDEQLTEPDFVRIEKNIAAFGFFTPSSKRIKNVAKIIKFTQTIDGNRVEAEVKISPNIEYGIPITADQDKYLAFQKIIERSKREEGKVENPITFTTTELIKLLGQSDAGLNFREVYEWLDLMQGTQIKSQGAVWIAGKKRFATDVFNLFSRVKRVGDELDDGTVADKNYVWLSDWYLENLNAHYLLPIDFESYKQLKNNISKALIPLLQVWLYASRETGKFEKRYSEICQVLNIKNYKYLSDIKRFFGRSLDELVRQGYLRNWEVKKTADKKDFKIIFRHGYKFYADRAAIKQLSGRKFKGGENRPAEPLKPENQTRIPKGKKEAARGQNSASETVSERQPETPLADNLPSAMTAEHLEAIRQLHIEYQVGYDKSVKLVCENLPETLKQLEAYPFRKISPKNKAGFLIQAIEEKYSLPEGYYIHLKEMETAAAQAEENLKAEAWRKENEAKILACPFCDKNGHRYVRHPKDKNYKTFHACTHDEGVEERLEDWR